MVLKVKVTEETVTDYLKKLDEHLEKSQKPMLDGIAEKVVDEITLLAPAWNPNLYESGYDTDFWKYNISDEVSSVQVLYTGFTKNSDDINVWWEFATDDTKSNMPDERELGRDYAYFQETGRDTEAKPYDARHQGFIDRGLAASENVVKNTAASYLHKIIKLQEIPKNTIQSNLNYW